MAGRDEQERMAEEARQTLHRLSREEGGVLSSALARASGHFGASDADRSDPVELWGRRIGRGLSLIGCAILVYMLGRQLGWW